MRKFSVTIDIAAPANCVWAVMSDTERWHEWTPSVTSIRKLTAGPFTVGTWVLIRQPKFPPGLWRVTAIDQGRSFSWVNHALAFRVVATHSVDSTPSGSRATLSLDIQGPLGGMFGRLTKTITEQYLGFEAAGLKARSESPSFRHREASP